MYEQSTYIHTNIDYNIIICYLSQATQDKINAEKKN